MNIFYRIFTLVILLTVVGTTWSFSETTQEDERALQSLQQSLQVRDEHVVQMRFLLKMIRDIELQRELEIMPDQISEMNDLVAKFQKSQIDYTIKNGDRIQRLNQLMREKRVVEATNLSDEMFAEFDLTMLSLNKQVEASILPHQLERLRQIAKQQIFMTRTPFRDEFGIALALAAELDVPLKMRKKTSDQIAARRRELLEQIEKLRKQARNDVVAYFPKGHRKSIVDVYNQYYDAERNRRLSSEKKYDQWKIAR